MRLNEQHALWALSAIGLLAPIKIHALIKQVGSAAGLWETPVKDWPHIGMGQALKDHIARLQRNFDPVKWETGLKEQGIAAVSMLDKNYPAHLKNLHDPPLVLYVKGELRISDSYSYLGVVGSRKRKVYGQKAIKDLLPPLIGQGLIIVSGMAYGIDSDAHQCSIDHNGYTIAVLGAGITVSLNSGRQFFAKKILENGALVSEYPPAFTAKKWTFPARNRIIAGISDAILVVEASKKSGALITADFATQLGKEVFAVPGSILSTTSVGTNTLIQNGAKLIMNSSDLAEEFKSLGIDLSKHDQKPKLVNELEERIYKLLCREPVPVDVIISQLGENAADIQVTLTMMSIRGLVEESPGRLFSIKK